MDGPQLVVIEEKAKPASWWIAGWRPGVGWVCVAALGLCYIPKAIALNAFWGYQAYLTYAHPQAVLPALPPYPDLGVTDLIGLLGGILGVGVLRTIEKVKDAEGTR